MCLEVKSFTRTSSVAKDSIVCYKRGTYDKKAAELRPHFREEFVYKLGVPTEEVDIDRDVSRDHNFYIREVTYGYHSSVKFSSLYSSHVFIIPKGSRYIEGTLNGHREEPNYVSSQIIWMGPKWSVKTWIRVMKYLLKDE